MAKTIESLSMQLYGWLLRTGTSWRDLPPDYGKLVRMHQRFIRWQRNSIWKKLFEIFKGNKKFKWLIIGSTYVKAHQYSCGARRGNQVISKTKGR